MRKREPLTTALRSSCTPRSCRGSFSLFPDASVLKHRSISTFRTLEQWMNQHDLSDLLPAFKANNISTVSQLDELALRKKSDLSFLGIEDEDRKDALLRAIQESGLCSFMARLIVNCDGWQEFGDITVYRFSAKYGLSQSQIYLRYSDFLHLNRTLKAVFSPQDARDIPTLPPKGIPLLQKQHDIKFIMGRQAALEEWLRTVVIMAERTRGEPLDRLLRFLYVIENAPETPKESGRVDESIIKDSVNAM
eukprot:scaffold1572_cov272-Pinguiococcus_pyrenoidosus.AAC.3